MATALRRNAAGRGGPPLLVTTLVDLIEHGTGSAAYYADVMEAVVGLAVQAPGGPPGSTADFLARLDAGWLTIAYASGRHEAELTLVRSAARQIGDIALRFRTLFRRLGGGLDGPGGFGAADAWYCILEGTAEITVAEAQARALVDLLASYAAYPPPGPGPSGGRREILLAVDEFSAVSRRLPVWELYERARSLGLAAQVSARSCLCRPSTSSCSSSCSSPASSTVHRGPRRPVTCTGGRRWTCGYAEQRTLNPRVRGSSPWRRTRDFPGQSPLASRAAVQCLAPSSNAAQSPSSSRWFLSSELPEHPGDDRW